LHPEGRLVDIGDTSLFVVEVGQGDGHPLILLHGGPGLDHHMWGDYLDPLGDRGCRLIFVDERGQGRSGPSDPSTWTLGQMAADVSALADALRLGRYGVLGHSYGAFVALQHAVDAPGAAAQTIVSAGVPSARFLAGIQASLEAFEPVELREQVAQSWAREASVRTPAEAAALMRDQWPFHFADPRDPRIEEAMARMAETVHAPEILRVFAANDYGAIEVEDRLASIPQPVLVLCGRHERTCPIEASELMAERIPDAELVVFEESAHMTFIEENGKYLNAVDAFLRRTR
jgi:proline iminopeptidase